MCTIFIWSKKLRVLPLDTDSISGSVCQAYFQFTQAYQNVIPKLKYLYLHLSQGLEHLNTSKDYYAVI